MGQHFSYARKLWLPHISVYMTLVSVYNFLSNYLTDLFVKKLVVMGKAQGLYEQIGKEKLAYPREIDHRGFKETL